MAWKLVAVLWVMATIAPEQAAGRDQSMPMVETLVMAAVGAPVDTGSKGVFVVGMNPAQSQQMQEELKKNLGKPNTEENAQTVSASVLEFFRTRLFRPLVVTEVETREQGVLVIRYLEASLDEDGVVVTGNKWTDTKRLVAVYRDYGVKEGEPVVETKVSAATAWLNSTQFRTVQPVYEAGETEGTSRVRIEVKDRFPFKPVVSVSNSGTENTGLFRFSGGVLIGDTPLPGIWMSGHQMSLQYTTNEHATMDAFSGSYSIPTRWSLPEAAPITVNLSGSIVQMQPEMATGFEAFSSQSQLYTHSAAVVAPWKVIETNTLEVSPSTKIGFDWKSYNSDMEFGGTSIYSTSPEIFQFWLDQSVTVRDPYGATTLGIKGVYSPGGFTDKNSDATYQAVQSGTSAEFWVLQGGVERLQRLPWSMSLRVKLDYQYTDCNLLPSEEISFGGAMVGRGYDLDIYQGDSGATGFVEILSPSWSLGRFGGSNFTFQMVGFLDWAWLYNQLAADLYEDAWQEGLSAGVGPRFQWGDRMSAKLDLGIPLLDTGTDEPDDWFVRKVKFSVSFAY